MPAVARFNLIREKLMVIISIYGGLRNSELRALKFRDLRVQTIGTEILNISISIREHKTKKNNEDAFSFLLSPNQEKPSMCPIRLYQRYISHWDYIPNSDDDLWKNMNAKQAKITLKSMNMGKNSVGKIGVAVAERLGLPEYKRYSSHCLRRSAATLLANSGISLLSLKEWGRWKSSTVAQGYIQQGVQTKTTVSKTVSQALQNSNSTSTLSEPGPPPKKLKTVPSEFQALFGGSTINFNAPVTIHFNSSGPQTQPPITTVTSSQIIAETFNVQNNKNA